MTNHRSPAKIIRSQKRLIQFLKSKANACSFSKSNLSICPQITIDIPSTIGLQPKLATTKLPEINIKPKKIYHPSIINACNSMFKKHPDNLSQEEIEKFNTYRSWKSQIGDPFESNPIFLPIGGLRTCLICANLT